MSLTDKVGIITGSAQGLGKAFSKILLENGAKILLTDVNESQGQITLQEFQKQYGEDRVAFQKCDVSSKEDMEGIFKYAKDKFGSIDIVCNNAGIGGEVEPLWEKTVAINLNGCFRGTFLGMDYMRKDKNGNGGVIVNISSMAGLNPNPIGPVYVGTKHAVIGFTSSWAMVPDVLANGVRLNMLCPSFSDTDFVHKINEKSCLDLENFRDFLKAHGIMSAEEVAQAFLELVVDESKNGAILKVSKLHGKQYHEVPQA